MPGAFSRTLGILLLASAGSVLGFLSAPRGMSRAPSLRPAAATSAHSRPSLVGSTHLRASAEAGGKPGASLEGSARVAGPPFDKLEAMKVWCVSDVHTDRAENMELVKAWPRHPDDSLVLVGDISHRSDIIEETLKVLKSKFREVFFVPGNHELWVDPERDAGLDSVGKFNKVLSICDKVGVRTAPALVGDVWVVPLFSFYDRSLDLTCSDPTLLSSHGGMDLTGSVGEDQSRMGVWAEGFEKWPWVDFSRCEWSAQVKAMADAESKISPGDSTFGEGRYPEGVSAYFCAVNAPAVEAVKGEIGQGVGSGVLSFSHFLPCRQTLPDWVKPGDSQLDIRWIDHAAAPISVKFSRVAGSVLIDRQMRELSSSSPSAIPHTHAFGHSHRPKDFYMNGVRYVHNPVGKGKEREYGMLDAHPEPYVVWGIDGPTPTPQPEIIRYWEMHGVKLPPKKPQPQRAG